MSDSAPPLWGFHMPLQFGTEPVERGFLRLGATPFGAEALALRDRDALLERLRGAYPDLSLPKLASRRGVIWNFLHAMAPGDLVAYPCKADRRVHVGELLGAASHEPEGNEAYPYKRAVRWLGSRSRDELPQAALNEIGSTMTIFRLRANRAVFLSIANRADAPARGVVASPPEEAAPPSDAPADAPSLEELTGDFVLRRLQSRLTGYEFEDFTADLLRCMGYTARVTQRSNDGGVDVLASRDLLGLEPPLIKVQCKLQSGSVGGPAVAQLYGHVAHGEHGLFVTTAEFTRDALAFERAKPNLRLIGGKELVALVLRHYDALPAGWRALLPLRRVWVPDAGGEGE